MNPLWNLAAAAGGAAANVLVNRGAQYLSGYGAPRYPPPPGPPPPGPSYYDMSGMQAALPRGRGRRRRGRGGRGRGRGRPQAVRTGGQPASGISTRSGATVVFQDTEILGAPTGTLQAFQFNPSAPGLVRLEQQEKMYGRYRIKYFNISFKSGSATNVAGNVALGILVGVKNDAVKTQADVLKLKPSFYVPAWKNETMTVGGLIDSQRYMMCGDTTNDGVSFTLYVYGTKDVGMIQVSYRVEFAYPHPF